MLRGARDIFEVGKDQRGMTLQELELDPVGNGQPWNICAGWEKSYLCVGKITLTAVSRMDLKRAHWRNGEC